MDATPARGPKRRCAYCNGTDHITSTAYSFLGSPQMVLCPVCGNVKEDLPKFDFQPVHNIRNDSISFA